MSYIIVYNFIFEHQTWEKGHIIASLMSDFPVEDIMFKEEDGEQYIPYPKTWQRAPLKSTNEAITDPLANSRMVHG